MGSLLIAGGRVIDPSQKMDRITNILIREGRIAAYDVPVQEAEQVLDATGKIVCPGLIDMHVHLREPGQEEDETIETGTAAALAGGFTTVVCAPNTDPPIDTQGVVAFIRHQAAKADHCNVYVLGCVSKNRQGKELAEIGQLVEAGAVGFTDDGDPIADAELLRQAFLYCRMFNKPILDHAEDKDLTEGGIMHEGLVSLILGLTGMPSASEEVIIARDIALAEATGGRLHLMHISTINGLEIIRRAKRRAVQVTCEVTPHHLTLTDECLRSFDPNYKVNPPLRGREHVEALVAALQDGTIDVIASDHAPHALEKKMQEIDQAPFGVIGLETTLGVIATRLIEPGLLDWPTVIEKMTINPARILGLPKGTLAIGADADLTIIDPEARWTVDPRQFRSKSSNTPFAGWELKGRAVATIVGGRIKYSCL
ncbi:MAG: dihydroorotase [Thermoguttaceae bacterium]|nr:dihydroorotase [Thermoguttaceae bacterium]MDW8038013.1 dihydroorotase [Thermoguttaceae bacterium]